MPVPFNAQSARAAALKGVELRRQRKLAQSSAHAALLELVPAFQAQAQASISLPQPQPKDDYQSKQLIRVREQIDMLSDKLTEAMTADETDAGAIDRLANALNRLRDQERILDGRPLPGSKRPATEKPKRNQGQSFEPVE